MLTLNNWKSLWYPILKKWFLDEYVDMPSKIGLVASIESTDKAQEIYQSYAGIGRFGKGVGPIPRLNASEAYRTIITPERWTGAIDIQYELAADDQNGVIKQLTQGLALSAKETRESDFWDLFNHAFDTTYLGGDGKSLCASDHPSPVSTATQSNVGTLSLTHANYVTARQRMRKFTDWYGRPIVNIPDMLLVPVDLEEQALVIAHSDLKPGTSNNDINVISNIPDWRLKVVVCEYLDDTNNWFLINTKYSKKHLHYLVREKLRLWNDAKDEDKLVLTFAGYYRVAYGFSDWRWVYGNNVA